MPSACAYSLKIRLGPSKATEVVVRTLDCELALHRIRSHLLST